jgi:hypothetical protein
MKNDWWLRSGNSGRPRLERTIGPHVSDSNLWALLTHPWVDGRSKK